MKQELLDRQRALCNKIGIHLYRSLLNFFNEILLSDYDLIVFKVRKCYALFRVFEPFLKDVSSKNIISSNCIELYMSDSTISSVLIVDDILIHGRTLLNFKKKLSVILPNAKIDIKVFAKFSVDNHDIDSIQDKSLKNELKSLRESVKCQRDVDEVGWKRISNSILCSLYCTNTPHISFVPTFQLNNSQDLFSKGEKYMDLASKTQELCGMKSYALIEDTGIFRNNPYQCVVHRIYMVGDNIKFVPFYILSSLQEGVLYQSEWFTKICGKNMYSGEFTFRLYTYLMSIISAVYYFKAHDINGHIRATHIRQ